MKKFLSGAAATAATLAFATGALAVGPPYCGTYATPAITAPTNEAGAACQAAITKNTQKYLKTVLKVRGKCMSQGIFDACPNTDDDADVQAAAIKASEGIAKACADTSGLGSSYQNVDDADVASCTLSQIHGTTEIFLGETRGTGANPVSNSARQACQAAISKAADKYLPSLLKTVDKCIDGRIKDGVVGDHGAACVGALSPSGLTPPSDEKVATSLAKVIEKATSAVADACGTLSAQQISFLYGCPNATTVGDLEACVECSGLNSMFELVAQQYAETGAIVAPAAGALQAAVNAGSAGDKFLIKSGNYQEGILLPSATCAVTSETCLDDSECATGACGAAATEPGAPCNDNLDCTGDTCNAVVGNTCDSDGDNMAFVGCGAATDDRPRVIPPALLPPDRGFTAAGVDGLHFQGLEVTGWQNDGIFVTNAEGVSFRDCIGDGDDLSTVDEDSVSTYAFFPITSNNVVVEGCEVVNVRDAGIYVGQSIGITVRYNDVHANVTGIEIENSDDADVYGNNAYDNTGGLLSFKLPSPPKQTSGGHHFFDNVVYENNRVNFAIPGTTVAAVPQGTGLMVLSEDDSVFENNIVRNNIQYGILIVDQDTVNAFIPGSFPSPSPDQSSENLQFLNNRLPSTAGSGQNGQTGDQIENPIFPGNWLLGLSTVSPGTCFTPVPTTSATAAGMTAFVACP